MCFFSRRRVARLIAVVSYGLFLGVLTLALHPRGFAPLADRLPVNDGKLVARSDMIPGATLNRGSKSNRTDSRVAFSLAKISQHIELQGVTLIASRPIQIPYQHCVDASRLIRAPPLPDLV